MKVLTRSGKVSKTIVVGLLEILSAFCLAAMPFIDAGDYSVPAVLLFVIGLLTIVLRHYTTEPLA